MDFPCSECHYCDKCFLLLKWVFSPVCQQGRRKKSQTKISDFPEEKGKYDTPLKSTMGPL